MPPSLPDQTEAMGVSIAHPYRFGTSGLPSWASTGIAGEMQRYEVERTLENIEALLSHQGAHLSDLKQAVVYLRDPSDGARARLLLASLLPRSVPLVVVEGRVCRPGWLVEIEGVGGIATGDARFGDFL